MCLWWGNRPASTFDSFEQFQTTLSLDCQDYEDESQSLSAKSLMSAMLKGRSRGELSSRRRRPPGILQFTPTDEMPDKLYYQSFAAKHLGGTIHLVDSCDAPVIRDHELTTFRPSLSQHLSSTTNHDPPPLRPARNVTTAPSRPSNRRIDYDVDDYDYLDDVLPEFALLEKCNALAKGKTSQRVKESSEKMGPSSEPASKVANVMGLPTFDHFPIRNINKRSAEVEVVTTYQCRKLFQQLFMEKDVASQPFLQVRKVDHEDDLQNLGHMSSLPHNGFTLDKAAAAAAGESSSSTSMSTNNRPRRPFSSPKRQSLHSHPKNVKQPGNINNHLPPSNPFYKLLKTSTDFFSPAKWFTSNRAQSPIKKKASPTLSRRRGRPPQATKFSHKNVKRRKAAKPLIAGRSILRTDPNLATLVVNHPVIHSRYKQFFNSEAEREEEVFEVAADEIQDEEDVKIIRMASTENEYGGTDKPAKEKNESETDAPGQATDKVIAPYPDGQMRSSDKEEQTTQPDERKSSYGQGFDPDAVQPETGFKPLVKQGDSIPSLAFSVYDGMDCSDEAKVSNQPQNGANVRKRTVQARDRGNVLVNIPSPVVHYVPRVLSNVRSQLPTVDLPVYTQITSADFSSFSTTTAESIDEFDDEEFKEMDRIDVQNLYYDSSALGYGKSTLLYGQQQFPSYVSQLLETQSPFDNMAHKQRSTGGGVYGSGSGGDALIRSEKRMASNVFYTGDVQSFAQPKVA